MSMTDAQVRARIDRYPVTGTPLQMRASFAQLADLPARAGALRCSERCVDGLPVSSVEPVAPVGADIVHLHGGGFVFGSARTHRRLAMVLSAASGRRVLLPEYPLAPEQRWPAPLNAVRGLIRRLSGERDIVLSGDSAGGQLALLCALAEPDASIAALLLFSPNTLRCHPECTSRSQNAARDAMNDPQTDDALASLMFGTLSASDPDQNPAECDLSALPPMFLDVGSNEVLLDDSLALATRAKRCGVEHVLHVEPGAFHLRQLFAQHWRVADDSLARAACWLNGLTDSRLAD